MRRASPAPKGREVVVSSVMKEVRRASS